MKTSLLKRCSSVYLSVYVFCLLLASAFVLFFSACSLSPAIHPSLKKEHCGETKYVEFAISQQSSCTAISQQSSCTHCGWEKVTYWVCCFSAVKLYTLWVGESDILSLLFLCSQIVHIVGGGKWHIEFAISLQSNCTHCGWKHNVFWICYFSSVKLYPNTSFGALKMLVNASTSTFGLVCSDGFGPEEATVACRDLGYPYGLQMCCSAFGYINSPPIRRTNLQCTGREQALRDCTYSISMDYCPSRKYASVICSSLSPNTGESQCLLCDKHFHWQASPLKCLWFCLGCVCTSNGGKGGIYNHLTVLCSITALAATTRICYASFTLFAPWFSVNVDFSVSLLQCTFR